MIHELTQRFYFEAAHTLDRSAQPRAESIAAERAGAPTQALPPAAVEGSRRIHGHTYHAEVTLRGRPDPVTGMLVDLGQVRTGIERLRRQLDHAFLDDVPGLGPATLENLCSFIHAALRDVLPGVVRVAVERTASGDRCELRSA